jgi:hypothetical protein
VEPRLDHFSLGQRLPEQQHGGKIRDRAAQAQAEKTLEGMPVVDLIFGLLVRQIIEPL